MRRTSISVLLGLLLLMACILHRPTRGHGCPPRPCALHQSGFYIATEPQIAAQPSKDSTVGEVKTPEELFRNGDKAAGRKKYEEALKNNPSLPPSELWLAKLEFAAKQPLAGRQFLETALEKHPDHPECFLFNSSIAFNEGRVAEGILNCQMALNAALLPRWTKSQRRIFQTEAYNGLAAAYESRGDWEGATHSLEFLTEIDPRNASLLVRLARAQFLTEVEKDALESLKLATSIDPNIGFPEVLLAQFQSQKLSTRSRDRFGWRLPPWIEIDRWINEATTHERFEKALKLYPDQAQPVLAYAAWLLDIGQLADAKMHLEQARKLKLNTADETQLRALLELLAKCCAMRFVGTGELLATTKTIVIVEAGQPAPDGILVSIAKVDGIPQAVQLPSRGPFDIWLLPKNGIAVRVVKGIMAEVGTVTEVKLDHYLGIVNACGDTHPPASLITVAPPDDPGPGEKGHKAIQVSKVYCVDMVVPEGVYSLWITPEDGGKPRKISDRLRVQAGKTVHQD